MTSAALADRRTAGVARALFLVVALSGWPADAASQAAEDGNDSPVRPVTRVEEEITVSALAVEAETATVTVVSREEIEETGAESAADALRLLSGVRLAAEGTLGGTSYAFVRGGDPNFTLVLLDGVPLNDASDRQGGAFDLATLATADLERIEVLRGPYSHYLGSAAVAGAVNLVTRRSSDPRGELSLGAGGDSWRRGHLSAGGPGGTAAWFAGADYVHEAEAVADDRFAQTSLQTSVSFDLRDGVELRVTGRYADLEAEDYAEASGGPVYGSGEVRTTSGDQTTVGLDLGLVADRWRHSASLSGNRVDREQTSPAIGSAVPRSMESRTYTRSRLGWLSQRRLGNADLAMGLQIDREDGDNASLLLLPPIFGGNVSGDYSLSRTTPGVFVDGTVRRGDLVVEAGMRADDPQHLDLQWSPRLGVRYRIGGSGWSVHSSWSRAFKLPSFFALASPPALGGNPDLLPETSDALELGCEYVEGPDRIAVVVFSNLYEDLIDFDFERFTHVNRSRVEADGVEISGRWSPAEKLRVSSDWTWQDVRNVTAEPLPVLHAPDWFGNVRVAWQALAPLEVYLEARFSDASADTQLPVPEITTVDGYAVLDLALHWRLADDWRLEGAVDNATDERYEHFVGFPHPGRRVRVTAGYRFR